MVRQSSPVLTLCVAFGLVTGGSAAWPATARGSDDGLHRVRSSDPSFARLIDYGIEHSPTFQSLAATVEASNGIVYVESGACAGHLAACLAMWMQSAGSHRFLRIVLDRKRLSSDARLIGAIGHELQHAIEVLSEPSTTNGADMYFFYKRYEPAAGNRFETMAAVDAGLAVQKELQDEEKSTQRLQRNSR